MNLFRQWGFTKQGWLTGTKGEYFVVIQIALLLIFIMLPVYQFPINFNPQITGLVTFVLSLIMAITGGIFIVKGFLDLGSNLTPLPYPIENSQLVQTGIYRLVRHPLYSGILLLTFAWSLYQISLTHLLASLVLLVFLDQKAHREETFLSEKHPDYIAYQKQVKKLFPGLY